MFERYSEMARRVIVSSRYMASLVGTPKIEPEHLLLGLLSKDKGLARRFLGSPWAAEEVWNRIDQGKNVTVKIPDRPVDLPLSRVCKYVLAYAAEEADRLSSKHIGTEHLFLGLLREEKCLAAKILHEHGVQLASVREELTRIPHIDSTTQQFVRERGSLPKDVIEAQARIKFIFSRVEDAVGNRDFEKARAYSLEETAERDKLLLLYRKHGLPDWLYL